MRHVLVSAAVATLLLILFHLVISLGIESLQSFASTVFMPGVVAEMVLSGNNINGFGDWRTPVLIDVVTWLIFWALAFATVKLWMFAAGR